MFEVVDEGCYDNGCPEDVFSPMLSSEGLKVSVSTQMRGHDDGNHTDGPIERGSVRCVKKRTGTAMPPDGIHTFLPDWYGQQGTLARFCRACTERKMYRPSGQRRGQKC